MSAAAVIGVRIKRIFAYLRDRGAVSPEGAVPESEIPYSDRWYFGRLVAQGAVNRVGDRCYLDEVAAGEYLRRRRARALVFLVAALLALGLYATIAALTRQERTFVPPIPNP